MRPGLSLRKTPVSEDFTVQVPLRISFLGGGTTIPMGIASMAGACWPRRLTNTFTSRYGAPSFFQHRMRVAYAEVEHEQTIAALRHPIFREVFRYTGIVKDIKAL